MRIDSSIIGMESERKYSSISGRVSSNTVTNRRQGWQEGTGSLFANLAQSDVKDGEKQNENRKALGDKENSGDRLQNALDEMRSRVNSMRTGKIGGSQLSDIRNQLMEIRRQCLDYLFDMFFPGRRNSRMQNVFSGFNSWGSNSTTYSHTEGYYYEETESTSFSMQATVKCADGREINFNMNLEMSRSFMEYYEETQSVTFTQPEICDPLVINLNGNIADLSDQTFYFDIDADGVLDEISQLGSGSGYLALDKNGDGIINDGSELFGTQSGNGFADLAAYDSDGNGFIDEGDEIWKDLKIWVTDANGNQQLYSLAEMGIGAICLMNQSTNFELTGQDGKTDGIIRRTGFFLYENGEAGTVQHVDLVKHNQQEDVSKGLDQNIQSRMSGTFTQYRHQQASRQYEQFIYGMAI